MRKLFVFSAAALTLYLAGCGGDGGTNGGGGDDYEQENLLVYESGTAPSITDVNDPLWASADSVGVRIGFDESYGVNPNMVDDTLILKAIKTTDRIYVRARWKDATQDIRGNFSRRLISGNWEFINYADGGGGEDALFMIFDAGNNGTEKADCASMCHAVANGMATTGGGNADSWSWKSATTNLARLAEDSWLKNTGLFADAPELGDKSLYTKNWPESAPDQPLWMHTDTTTFEGLTLYVEDTVVYHNIIGDGGWQTGDRVPGNIIDTSVKLDSPLQGRYEVEVMTGYSGGYYTLVMTRLLTTTKSSGESRNDVNLADLDSIQVTMAISNRHTAASDDATWREHSGSIPFYLVFNRVPN